MSCTVSKRPFDVALMEAPAAVDGAWLAPALRPLDPNGVGAAMDLAGPNTAGGVLGTSPKRCRTTPAAPWTPQAAAGPAAHNGATPTSADILLAPGPSPLRPYTVAVPYRGGAPAARANGSPAAASHGSPSSAAAIMADFDRLLPRRKRPASGNSSVGSALFTYAEVKDITSRALQEQEERLRAEFHAALRDRLNDQYENFSKFNQDFVSRQLRESHFDYMT